MFVHKRKELNSVYGAGLATIVFNIVDACAQLCLFVILERFLLFIFGKFFLYTGKATEYGPVGV